MRVTRARAQQNVEEPTDSERGALTEISPNASPEQLAPEVEPPKKTVTRSKSKKGGKKGAKGKKGKATEEEEPVQVVTEDEKQGAASPANDAAAEELVNDMKEGEFAEIYA